MEDEEKKILGRPVGTSPHAMRVTDGEQHMMFEYWRTHDFNHGSTATEFGRAKTTVLKMARVYNWEERRRKIDEKVFDSIADKIAKRTAEDLEIIDEAIIHVALYLLSPDCTVRPRYHDLVDLMRLKLEMAGQLPSGEAKGGDTYQYYNLILGNLEGEEGEQHNSNLAAIFNQRCKNPRL